MGLKRQVMDLSVRADVRAGQPVGDPGGGATAGSPCLARLHARHAREARGTPRNGTSFLRGYCG